MKRFLLPFVLSFFFTGCPTPQPSSATCATVCANMVKLSCPSAKPTAKGATCEQVCNNVQNSGAIKWDLTCRSKALTCAAADLCEAK